MAALSAFMDGSIPSNCLDRLLIPCLVLMSLTSDNRGVNPNWKPGGPGDVGQFGPHPMRKPVQVQQRRDVLLENNPEFSLPFPAGRGRGGRGNGGRRPGPPISTLSGGPGGRYPGNEF